MELTSLIVSQALQTAAESKNLSEHWSDSQILYDQSGAIHMLLFDRFGQLWRTLKISAGVTSFEDISANSPNYARAYTFDELSAFASNVGELQSWSGELGGGVWSWVARRGNVDYTGEDESMLDAAAKALIALIDSL